MVGRVQTMLKLHKTVTVIFFMDTKQKFSIPSVYYNIRAAFFGIMIFGFSSS